MSAAGFDYKIGLTPAQQVALDPKNTMSADDYAERYGFGYSAEALGVLNLSSPDPTGDYRRTLSPSKRDAYDAALNACSGFDARRSAALGAAVESFRDLVMADPRFVDATQTWSDCMSAAGFSYSSPQQMRDVFGAKVSTTADRDQLQQTMRSEISTAIANVPCEEAFRAMFRSVIASHAGEFQRLIDAALADPSTASREVG